MADTTIPVALVQQAWAKDTWEAGIHDSFFAKFMGKNAASIIHVKEELKKTSGDKITIPLLLPLSGSGVSGDNILEGNEEKLEYRDFNVNIDLIRNAVRLEGRMEEQKTQIDLRGDAKTALTAWLSRYIDTRIFAALTGVQPSGVSYTVTAPSADRVVYAGSATQESEITAAGKMSTALIGKAKRIALANEDKAIRPVRVNGRDLYVMVVDQYQARDLKQDSVWLAAQEHANVRGDSNPIFSGMLGMYDGVIIHESLRVPRTATGADSGKVSHALLLGAQAAVFAEGAAPTWKEKNFDYDNKYGVALGRMFGIEKAAFKFGSSLTPTDFGVVNVLTSSVDD